MSKMKQTTVTILLLFLCWSIAASQVTEHRMTEADVTYQDKFIEAKGYLIMDRADKAKDILLELYKDDKTNAAVATELVDLYAKLDDPERQFKYAKVAAENANGNPYHLQRYGDVSMAVGDYTQAVNTYTTLLISFPDSEEYTDKLAKAHLQMGEQTKAIAAFQNLEKRIGVTKDVSRRKFEIYDLAGDKKAALAELQALADAVPSLTTLHNLAKYNEKLGKVAQARKVYEQILELDINDTKANIALMGSANEPTDDSKYLRALAPIIENENLPIDSKVLELVPYVQKLADANDIELAASLTELGHRLVAIHPKEAKSHALLADVLYMKGETTDAIKAYERTLQLDNSVYTVWEQLLYAYMEVGMQDKLLITAEEVVDLFPNKSRAYYLYGTALTTAKKYTDAQDYLSDGVLIAGKNIPVKSDMLAALAIVQQRLANTTKAIETVNKALDISQNKNPTALEAKGDILMLQGQKEEALSYWQQAQAAGSSNTSLAEKITQQRVID